MKEVKEIFVYEGDNRFGFWDKVLHFMEICRKELQNGEQIGEETYVLEIRFVSKLLSDKS